MAGDEPAVQRTPGLTVPPVGKPNVGWPWKVVFDVIVARQALVEEAKLRAGGLAPGLYACGDVRIVYAMLRRWAAEERKDP